MHVGHLPLTALEPNLRRNQGGAFRKDRQLQLRHASILPSPSLSRKRTGGQLIFQNGSQNHGMRSGVLKLHFGKLTLKIYTKGERVLRVEPIVHNTQELRCGRRIERFPKIVSRLRSMAEGFLNN